MLRRFRIKRRRFRAPLVVLQVQRPVTRYENLAGRVEVSTNREWRDATAEDLMNGELDSDHREP